MSKSYYIPDFVPQSSEFKGADSSELRGQVDFLLFQAYPRECSRIT